MISIINCTSRDVLQVASQQAILICSNFIPVFTLRIFDDNLYDFYDSVLTCLKNEDIASVLKRIRLILSFMCLEMQIPNVILTSPSLFTLFCAKCAANNGSAAAVLKIWRLLRVSSESFGVNSLQERLSRNVCDGHLKRRKEKNF